MSLLKTAEITANGAHKPLLVGTQDYTCERGSDGPIGATRSPRAPPIR